MIYDCFTFFNELELLELRLNELANVVDKFVLVEAARTHSNKPKPLHYRENRARFSQFHDKIIHIEVDDMPDSTDPWDLENHQRNCIGRGLSACRPDDLVLVSDLDEIPRSTVVAEQARQFRFRTGPLTSFGHAALNSRLVRAVFHRRGFRRILRKNHPFILRFRHTLFRYFVNCRSVRPAFTYGTQMLFFRDFSCAEEVRHSGCKAVDDAGWHFSFMGGVDRIRQKLDAYAHQERNRPEFTDPNVISARINSGVPIADMKGQLEFVPLDGSFPRYLLENPQKYSSWIKPV